MNIEVEISEAEVKDTLQKYVLNAVRMAVHPNQVEDQVKRKIAELWPLVVDKMIRETLADSPAIQEQIKAEITRKLKAKINAAMKVAESGGLFTDKEESK